MKKVLLLIALLIVVTYINKEEYNNMDNSIRFRVIANSNQSKDIIMKEKVVHELSNILFKEENNYEDVNKNIYDNLKIIENKIDLLFKNNNYDKTFIINYGLNEFPQKIYRGKVLKAGKYKSLVIEIGEGKGDNYFCFLYPSLCLLDLDDLNSDKPFDYIINSILK